MTEVRIRSLRKEFGDTTAVDGIDLEIRDGEFLVLVGPSGCGKSTTLRLLAGLETPTDGRLLVDDESVVEKKPKARGVAMVFQDYALYPHMTAEENMTFGAGSATSFSAAEIARRAEESARILDIEELLDRRPSELSGGEKQRVAIGRALVRDPEIFLLDEPLSNLDAKLRTEMRAELASIHEQVGTTTVYVTHDQTEAMTLADRVAVMNDGRIQQVDTPQRLYDVPATRFVAEFIGSPSMNTLAVDLVTDGESWRAVADCLAVELPDREALDGRENTRAVLGIRPEDLAVEDATDSGPTALDVATVEPLGDVQLVRGTVGGQDLIVQTTSRTSADSDATLPVGYDADRLHLFDPETGRAFYHSDPDARAVDAVVS
jgi:multiple sugar transport system ATP-binding protein